MNQNNYPKVSIVILTKNGGNLFEESIRMIFSQQINFSYEVVIVDSGSTDGTLEFLKKYPVRIFYIKSEEFSFGKTRDFGFEQAQGEYIVSLSQDMVPKDGEWLQKLIVPLINNETDVVQGSYVVPEDRRVFFWEKNGWFWYTSEWESFCRKYGDIGLSCTNLAIKKSVWEKLKFGSAPMNEDKMLQKKLYSKGYRMKRQLDAVGYHGHRYNLISLMKRCENEGFGWRCVGVRYSLSQMFRDYIQKKWVYGTMIRALLRGEIINLTEVLFVFVRPIFLYKGNLVNRKYKL